jgi:cytochrome c-type biogenesis protein CcmH/NrfG
MARRVWYLAVAAVALAAAGLVSAAPGRSSARTARPAPSPARIRELDIAFYQARTIRDPRSARDFTQLAALYLQRARETADNADLERAETTARHSLALRRGRNDEAVGVLASSLMGQHRFAEAHDVALELLRADSTSVAARGMVAEAAMELGRYDEAARLFGMLASYQADLGTAPRLARAQAQRVTASGVPVLRFAGRTVSPVDA